MHIRCPNCQHAIDTVDDASFKNVPCPECGSSFSLVADEPDTEAYRGDGTTIAHFRFTEKLGVGAFGTVWKATDTKLDRTVAVKIPRKEQLTEQELEGFFREARAAGQLLHPNIVAVHEVGRDGDNLYIVSDYVQGADLKAWMREQPLPPREAAELCAKIAGALHYANERGVVHRDLKPSNIMMDLRGEPFIMDFGLAKRDSGEVTMTVDGAILGTPAYMSPEQAKGLAHQADRRSDVYSLGVILFQMLTASLPFQGDKQMLIVQILTEDPPNPRRRNSRIPKDLETICLKCLRKEPKERYQTAEQLADDLRRFLAGEPITARPISRLGKVWKWSKRRPMVAALIVMLAVTVLGAFIALREVRNRTYAHGLVEQIKTAEIDDVAGLVERLQPYRGIADPWLFAAVAEAKANRNAKQQLRASLALLPRDPTQVEYLYNQLLVAEPDDFPVVRNFLSGQKSELIDKLWAVLEQEQHPQSGTRLRAAAALATYDRANPKWKTVNQQVAAELATVPLTFLNDWKEAFRPVAGELVEPLAIIFADEDEDELARSLATSLLVDYAGEDVQQLTSLVSNANEKQFAVLYPILVKHDSDAVRTLRSILEREIAPAWMDPPLDPAWRPVLTSINQSIESAQGLVDERCAFCQTMPLKRCVEVTESLRQSGYRPVRFRPYAVDERIQVAAVWTRDSRAWQLGHDLTVEQLQAKDREHRQQRLVPVDVAGCLARDQEGLSASRYAAIWVKSSEDDGEVRMYAGVPVGNDQTQHAKPLIEAGFNRLTIQAFVDQSGATYRSSVWSKRKDREDSTSRVFSGMESNFTGEIYPGLLLTDLTIARAGEPPDRQQRYAEQLKSLEPVLAERTDDAVLRKSAALLRYQLKRDEQGLADLNWLIEKLPDDTQFLLFRAIVHARTRRAAEAKQDLARFVQLNKDISQQAYLDAVVSAHLGEDAEGLERLEAVIGQAPGEPSVLYNAACAYSLAADAVATRDAARSQAYADRAVALLREVVASGSISYEDIEQDGDLDPLRRREGFAERIGLGKLDRRYDAVWNENGEFESTEVHGLAPDEHLARCRALAAAGYRPAAMSVSTAGDDSALMTGSVWHRPAVPDAARETLAKQQANAAVALLRMDQGEAVWPLLKHSPDPRARSYLIHQLSPLGADPQAIIKRLNVEPDVSIRRALIQALGEFDEQRLPTTEREKLAGTLLDRYATDPDAGVHGAAEWVLRRWGQQDSLKEKDRELATGKPAGDRRWYVNQHGQTLVAIPGPVEFVMGGSQVPKEIKHHKRINRSFAIMTHEVTLDQFRAFRSDYPYNKQYAPDGSYPINQVTWYAAAEYCNWLSKQDDIPRDQWCYLPNDDGAYLDGMRAAPDFLERIGYRLPTEAEWEYACRAGAVTRYCFGASVELLWQYASYDANSSQNRGMLPVGTLKPNDLGLFDAHGNVLELCHDLIAAYRVSLTRRPSDDVALGWEVHDSDVRISRGGAFYLSFYSARSADRDIARPGSAVTYLGLRVARTLP